MHVFSSITPPPPPLPQLCPDIVQFACWIVPKFWSFTRKTVPDLVVCNAARLGVVCNGARLGVVCALNWARISVVRALDCAQFHLHPALSQPRWDTEISGASEIAEMADDVVMHRVTLANIVLPVPGGP